MKNPSLLLVLLFNSVVFSQTVDVGMQLRPRFEYRNGYKTLLTEYEDPAIQTSQRTRIIIEYKDDDLQVKFSPQSINIWGDSPAMRLEDNNSLSVFEAYGQYTFQPGLAFRLGRQVLSYDNQRILGEVNWAQQGQSHDAALVSWKPDVNHTLDLVFAYNAETETLLQSAYMVNSYQNLQMVWYHFGSKNLGLSVLLMNTGYELDNPSGTREIDYLQTFGAYHNFIFDKFSGDVGLYGQTGSRNNREISAWYSGMNLNYKLAESLRIGVGAEYLSGTHMDKTSEENNSFTPLFGTNHAFNGHMDYFYVGNHHNSVGLIDLYGKFSYHSPKIEISLVPHIFSSAATIIDSYNNEAKNYLGTEVDLFAGFKIRKDLQVNLGYSQMFGSRSLEILRGGEKDITQNWAWTMVTFTPQLFFADSE